MFDLADKTSDFQFRVFDPDSPIRASALLARTWNGTQWKWIITTNDGVSKELTPAERETNVFFLAMLKDFSPEDQVILHEA